MITYHWFDHIIGFILLIALPLASLRSGPMSDEPLDLPPKKHLYYTNGLVLIIASSIIITIWNLTDRPWTMLGFDWILPGNIAFIALATVSVIYTIDLWWSVKQSKTKVDQDAGLKDIIPLTNDDFKHYIFLALAAGICEEIMYRGFLIPYVNHWFHGVEFVPWIGICLPAISFGISHLYQGWLAVLKILTIGILLGIIFFYSQSLIIVVILHVLIDLVSGYVGMMVLANQENKVE